LAYTDDDGETFYIKHEQDLTEAIEYFTSGEDEFNSVTLRLDVLVEYDGPSLSDTSSVLSFGTQFESRDSESQGSWGSSAYTRSRQSDTRPLRDPLAEDYESPRPVARTRRLSTSSQDTFHAPSYEPPLPPLTGPESEVAPSLLTHSELGSRWLREQSNLTRRNVGVRQGARRRDSDEESSFDRDSQGDFDLVKDDNGRECCHVA
jgi:hypothetical protein